MEAATRDGVDAAWTAALRRLPAVTLTPCARHLLREVFPPSRQECYGTDAMARGCHYAHVVAILGHFYFVGDRETTEKLQPVWLHHFFAEGGR